MNIRRLALDLLGEYEEGSKYANLSLSSHSLDSLSKEERASLTVLFYTTVERKLTYDYYISSISSRSPEKIDPVTRNILRLGLCQIEKMTSVPDFAAVNETVKLARNKGEAAFVNGVLRAAVRSKDSLPLPDKNKNYKRYLSIKYSFPLHLVKHLSLLYGETECEKLLMYFNGEKYTDLTVNTLEISAEEYTARLAEKGYSPELTVTSVRIPRSVNPEELPGFSDGHFFVQDRASYISSLVLSAKRGETVVDTCACPGGKSFAAAISMENEGRIYSLDLHESKLSLIRSGADRLGIRIIAAEQCDATEGCESLFATADAVICDAPCSGLGVLGKKPDLRYKSIEEISELPKLQLEILKRSALYPKVGGRLVYSTCTLNPLENEEVVKSFLAENPDFEVADFEVLGYRSDEGMLTLLPSRTHTDGFFIAKLIRKR